MYLFLERGRKGERETETLMCGCLLHTHHWVPGPQSRYVPWVGIKPATLWFTGWHSIHWTTPARAQVILIPNNQHAKVALFREAHPVPLHDGISSPCPHQGMSHCNISWWTIHHHDSRGKKKFLTVYTKSVISIAKVNSCILSCGVVKLSTFLMRKPKSKENSWVLHK